MPFGAEVSLVGVLITEPTNLSFTGEGRARCSFQLLVARTWTNKQTQQEEGTRFSVPVVCWGTLAENVKESLQKGDRVVVQGKLEENAFQDAHRDEFAVLELIANDCGPTASFGTLHVVKNPRRDDGGQTAGNSRSSAGASRNVAGNSRQGAHQRETAAHQRATASTYRATHEDDEPF